MKNFTVQELSAHIQSMNALVDQIHVVDPVTGAMFDPEQDLAPLEDTCSCCVPGREARCTNCVGYQALRHGAPSFKLEACGDKVYVVTARPVLVEGRPLVVETASDVTAQMSDWGQQANAQKRMLDQYNDTQVRDFLTGVYNCQYVEGCFAPKLPRLFEEKAHVHVALVDVRRFKRLGEVWGQAVADQVLCYVPNWFRLEMTEGQFVARFHGDQFLLVEIGAKRSLKEFQASIQENSDRIGGECVCGQMNNKVVPIQLAISIAGLLETEHGTLEELLALLMDRLQAAKKADDGKVKYL